MNPRRTTTLPAVTVSALSVLSGAAAAGGAAWGLLTLLGLPALRGAVITTSVVLAKLAIRQFSSTRK